MIPKITSNWSLGKKVKACFTLRGTWQRSNSFSSFNVASHVGDSDQQVAMHRNALEVEVGATIPWLSQNHGVLIADLDAEEEKNTKNKIDNSKFLTVDGATTLKIDQPCAVMVADCLAILIYDASTQRVAALHAGWRGLAGSCGLGIIDHYFATFVSQKKESIYVWLSPAIGQSYFEVGVEVRDAFVDFDAGARVFFQPVAGGKYQANLAGLAHRKLEKLGVIHVFGNEGTNAWCTYSHPERFYSYRRDKMTGRHVALIALSSL